MKVCETLMHDLNHTFFSFFLYKENNDVNKMLYRYYSATLYENR